LIIEVLNVLFQFDEIIIFFPKSVFKAIVVDRSVLSTDDMCEEAEIVSQGVESVFMDSCFAFTCQIGKYSPVFPEKAMHIPDKIVSITVQPVVVIVPALVGAEFFIGTATKGITAIETFSFHST